MDNNQHTYQDASVVKYYASQSKLQKPEKNIFNSISDYLKESTILDIGIGGGRTSTHLIPLVKKYTGVDYSQNMVDFCINYFKNPNVEFLFCDARDMSIFNRNTFDFVIFSFNGIDCVSYENRSLIFSEMRRVLKKGGYFCFSTHNIHSIPNKYLFHIPRNPFNFLKEYNRYKSINRLNKSVNYYRPLKWTTFRDGAENFKLDVLYIDPILQLEQLIEYGFDEIKIYRLSDGKEILSPELKDNKEPWVYFLCK